MMISLTPTTTTSLLLISASIANAAGVGLTYTPVNDVTSHSTIALDQLDITALIDSGDFLGAKEIYINGKNRDGKSLQQMATIDWAGAGVEDLTDFYAYATLFRTGDGEPYLDAFNLDAMNCDGSFEGQSTEMCAIAAKKNLLCTGLTYAQYEGVKAIQYQNEKNWDEMYAFWNGVYDDSIDERVNSGAPGAVQISRDSDFGTSFHQASLQAIIDGQKGFSGGFKKATVEVAYEDFKRANLATFAQATLKYAALFEEAGLEQAKVDGKWGEGYTYFRCGAGLMDPELALFVDYVLDPRDKKDKTLSPNDTVCKILEKMLSLPEIGMGVQVEDLNIENYLPTIKADCGIENFDHVAGYSKSENERVFIPVLGFLVVVAIYAVGFCKFGKSTKQD